MQGMKYKNTVRFQDQFFQLGSSYSRAKSIFHLVKTSWCIFCPLPSAINHQSMKQILKGDFKCCLYLSQDIGFRRLSQPNDTKHSFWHGAVFLGAVRGEVSPWVSEDVNMTSFRAGDVTPGEPSHMCRRSSGTPGKHGHTRVFYHVQKVPRPTDPRANQVYEMRN